jgi:chromosome segregation ATPase
MQVLENKQKVLEETKRESTQLENKVKQLKDEALASRKQLDDLRRREQVLEHDRDLAVKEKNQIQYKKNSLQDNITQLQMRCDSEMNVLQSELNHIIYQTKGIIDKNETLVDNITNKIKQRQEHVRSVYLIKRQVRLNTESFAQGIRSNLQSLQTEMNSKSVTQCTTHTVTQCKTEVNSLVTRIKTIAAEMTEST